MLCHGQGLLDVPGSELLGLAHNGQALTQSQLRGTNLQTYRSLVFRRGAQCSFASHHTVCECRAIHVGILRNVQPVVIDRIVCPLDGSKLQPVRLHEPLVAYLSFTAEEAVIVVNIRTCLRVLGQFAEPVQPVKCCHLVNSSLGGFFARKDVQYQLLTESGMIFHIE